MAGVARATPASRPLSAAASVHAQTIPAEQWVGAAPTFTSTQSRNEVTAGYFASPSTAPQELRVGPADAGPGATDRATVAAESAGKLMNQLPEVLARERQATIDQIMDALYAQEARVRELAVALRGTLEAGTATSDSLNTTIKSLDALMARFQPPPGAEPAVASADAQAPPGKPFDIAEYTIAMRELASTARELQSLVQAIDAGVPGIAGIAQGATADVEKLIDKLFWNLLLLALIVIVAAFAAALGYRLIRRRIDVPG